MSQDSLREKFYIVIFESDTRAGRVFDVVLLVLIVLSILSLMLESIETIQQQYKQVLQIVEWMITILFSIEYLLRLWCVKTPTHYARSFFGIIDLLAVLPAYISVFFAGFQYLLVIRILRLLRVFRILKMARYLGEASILSQALKASSRKITVFIFVIINIVTVVGTLMYLIEGAENGFTNIPKSVYWAIVTLTTVGYGDIAPHTPLGQVLASFLMIMGYGIIAVPTGIVSAELTQAATHEQHQKADTVQQTALYCQCCGQIMQDKG